mmetsp:Transcript_30840/g.88392  ORF Transcript_30840/g.88392 Transcript_30840/m.88392 type:complete len:222 (-) Transcript_30840:430-1095(-)
MSRSGTWLAHQLPCCKGLHHAEHAVIAGIEAEEEAEGCPEPGKSSQHSHETDGCVHFDQPPSCCYVSGVTVPGCQQGPPRCHAHSHQNTTGREEPNTTRVRHSKKLRCTQYQHESLNCMAEKANLADVPCSDVPEPKLVVGSVFDHVSCLSRHVVAHPCNVRRTDNLRSARRTHPRVSQIEVAVRALCSAVHGRVPTTEATRLVQHAIGPGSLKAVNRSEK